MSFYDILGLLQEAPTKSIKTLKSAPVPDVLGQKGRPSPRAKKQAEHGFKILTGKYRAGMEKAIRRYLSGAPLKTVRQEVEVLMRDSFERAFVNGMRSAAGLDRTPTQIRLAPEHRKWINTALTAEFGYFEQFLQDIRYKRVYKSGRRKWEDRIEAYSHALSAIRSAGELAASPETTVLHWDLNPAEHCDGCIYLASISPLPRENLPFTPRDGSTPCMTNCRCNLRRQVVKPDEYRRIVQRAPSASTIRQRMKRINDRRGKRGQTTPSRRTRK